MASGERRIEKLGETHFRGQVGRAVSDYAKNTQRLAHDMAAELDVSAETARAAMWKLRKLPAMRNVDVWVRARLVARHLKRARDLCQGISAEAVKFNLAYRREFLQIDDSGTGKGRSNSGDVRL